MNQTTPVNLEENAPISAREKVAVWQEMTRGVLDTLRFVMPCIALVYGVIAITRINSNERLLPPAIAAAGMLITWLFVLRIKQPTNTIHWIALLPCMGLLAIELIEYHDASATSSRFYLSLYLLAVSLILVSIPQLLICLTAAIAGWITIELSTKSLSGFTTIYAHAVAIILGVSMTMMRRRMYIRLCRARLREQAHWQAYQETHRELTESDRRFQQFAAHSDQIFWINQWNPERNVYVNPAYERLTGRTIESLNRDPNDWLNTIHPTDRPAVERAYQRVVETNVFDEEYRIIRPDGSIRWVRDQGTAMVGDNGIVNSVAGIVSDITERRKVEDALRASQSQLFNLMAELDGIVWEADAKTIAFTFVSGRAEEILGYPPKQWIQTPEFWHSILHPDDRDATVQLCVALTEKGLDHECDYRCIAADGRVVWIRDKVRLVRDENGNITQLRGIMFDITASKLAEKELFASEERFRNIFEHSPDAVFVESMDGEVLDVNDAACHLHQMSREELIGKNLRHLVPTDDLDHVERNFPRVAAGEITFFEGRRQPAAGDPIPVEIRVNRIEHEGEQALLLHVRDISERIAAEREQQQLADQVRQMQKLEAVGTLASGVAHDFNNLLTAINGFIDLARRDTSHDHPIHKQLNMIEQAAEQGAGVTRSLLTFAQKLPTRKQPVDLGQITRDTVRLLHRLMPATIDLHDVCIDRPVWVNADGNQMQQVLMNLAINGRDAMPDGGELTVTLEDVTDEVGRPHAQLTVLDTGTGMTEQVQRRIFEPFFTTKTREQGTGLGLAIIHGILEDHGGAIHVDSTPGVGTTITVNLPCCDKPEPAYELWQDPHPSHEGRHLLLAEDNEYVCAIMTSTLRGEGFIVTAVADGEQLLAAFKKHRANLAGIVLDLDLPKTSGDECLAVIRQTDANLPVIIVTANAHRFLESNSEHAEVVLSKPFPMSDLIDACHHAIRDPSGV